MVGWMEWQKDNKKSTMMDESNVELKDWYFSFGIR